MNDGFIKVADTATKGSTSHSAISLADPDTADEYKFGALQGSMQGTIVPTTNRKGELRNSPSPFGSIVVGKTYRYKDGELYDSPEEFEPTHLRAYFNSSDNEAETAPAATSANVPKEVSDAERQLQAIMDAADHLDIHDAAPGDEEIDLLPAPALSTKAMSKMIAEAVRVGLQADVEDTVSKEDPEPIRVKMEGSFGSYRGTYSYVYVEDSFVILVYDREAQVFSPPTSAGEFSVTCDGTTYEVYFPGIEFELPFTDCGIQVMIRSAA
jgi:hypothetical protein